MSSNVDAMMIASTRFRVKRPKVLEGRLLNTYSIQFQSCGMNQSIKKNIPAMMGIIGIELARLYSKVKMAAIATNMLKKRKTGLSSLPFDLFVSFSVELFLVMQIPIFLISKL